MSDLRFRTPRLDLHALTSELANAELDGRAALSEMLGARVPEDWPPPLMDDTVEFFRARLVEHPEESGWWMWYWVTEPVPGDRVAVGVGGYKGPPTPEGTVEVGYSVVPEYQRRGFASEAVHALVARAFAHEAVRTVFAETYPELRPSIRVLERNGFTHVGRGSEPRVIRYALTRGEYSRRRDRAV